MKIPRPHFKRKYLRYIWLTIVILAGIAFIAGQFAIYLVYA
ncbi:MAG: hypothetical protein NUV69_00365 [Candidatus Curtissbacteria bacterium]|nr:hypothetical protein [Candidatus Curtissbacteria bacterium]